MPSNNYLLIFSFLISLCISSTKTFANEQVLATITTDVNSESYNIVIDTDLETHLLQAFYIDNNTAGQQSSRDELVMGSFMHEGIRLPKNSKYDFVRIVGQNFDQTLGGSIIIDTLFNILTGKRKSYEIELAQDVTGWKLFHNGKPITRIIAIAHKIPIVGIVGVKNLDMN